MFYMHVNVRFSTVYNCFQEYKIPIDLSFPRKYLKSVFAFHAKTPFLMFAN